MSTLAFIDNFINDPVNHCVNDFVETYNVPVTYHQPARFGFNSLDLLHSDPLGVVILGSASHVTEGLDWHRQLEVYFKRWQRNRVPVLGICFGHQFIAQSFGGEVGFYCNPPINTKAIRKVDITQSFWNYEKGESLYLPYAHEQIVTSLPSELESLATCANFQYEIIRHKELPIYGVQAHPESSLKFMEEVRSLTDPKASKLQATGRYFLGEFLSLCQSRITTL